MSAYEKFRRDVDRIDTLAKAIAVTVDDPQYEIEVVLSALRCNIVGLLATVEESRREPMLNDMWASITAELEG